MENVAITPESVAAEIRSRFTNANEFRNTILERFRGNYPRRCDVPRDVNWAMSLVVDQLVGLHSGQIKDNRWSHTYNYQNSPEKVKDNVSGIYSLGQRLGLLIALVYYGEVTFISQD